MQPVHGLDYPRQFLDSLPLLQQRPAPHQPLRAIDAQQFADIHLAHFTNDVPDSVLFPFLHGLEADNHAQNTFFAGTGGLARDDHPTARAHTVTVPRYRGLVWVVCDDDPDPLPSPPPPPLPPHESHSPYDDDDDDDDDDWDCDADSSLADDDDPDVQYMQVDNQLDLLHPHMHPQAARKPISIDTTPSALATPDPSAAHDRRLSTSSDSTDTTTASSDSYFGFLSTSASYSTASSSPGASPITELDLDDCLPAADAPSPSLPPASPSPPPQTKPRDHLPLLTSTFQASDLLCTAPDGGPMFIPPRVPDGISLRNFGIQVPIYATLADIVVYSPAGATRAAFALAQRFKLAIERKAAERAKRYENAGLKVEFIVTSDHTRKAAKAKQDSVPAPGDVSPDADANSKGEDGTPDCAQTTAALVAYNVFVLSDTLPTIVEKIPWLLSRPPPSGEKNAVAPNVADRSENADAQHQSAADAEAPRKPSEGAGPVEKHRAVWPNAVDFAQREREEMRELTRASPIVGDCVFLGNSGDVPHSRPWRREQRKQNATHDSDDWGGDGHESDGEEDDPFDSSDNPAGYDLCIQCRDYEPFPTPHRLRQSEAHLAALDALWSARRFAATYVSPPANDAPGSPPPPTHCARPPPSAAHIVHLAFPASPPSGAHALASSLLPFLTFISSLISPRQHPPSTRRKRVLIYSGDGYTESSVLALCLLMQARACDLPRAYLALQVDAGRSFFVYQSDLAVLKRIEARLARDRDQLAGATQTFSRASAVGPGWNTMWAPMLDSPGRERDALVHGRVASSSISYPSGTRPVVAGVGAEPSSLPSPPIVVPSQNAPLRRPRASTSPLLPPHVDHQTWFNDPRFDGSFPSRVLPFLYLGNLNHASNVYMLHALGITHVVSVGECALIPPVNIASGDSACGYQFVAGKGPGGQGSLWIEEREGRIRVLDIKGVCDDGIDSLQPQLAPVCDWIDRARSEGGKVLVHCRVGVSRSATVTIAYVMKHLSIPLVDAYLIVRSRRLSVLIQPNMRLLFNLCGWEVQLARERAQGDVEMLRRELARSLNWPFLAREVHRLNEKYLL